MSTTISPSDLFLPYPSPPSSSSPSDVSSPLLYPMHTSSDPAAQSFDFYPDLASLPILDPASFYASYPHHSLPAERPYTPPMSDAAPSTAQAVAPPSLCLPTASTSSASSASPTAPPPARETRRFNPVGPRPAARRARRAMQSAILADEDDDDFEDLDAHGGAADDAAGGEGMQGVVIPSTEVIQRRREEIRRQRIESEQRRRDELRDGYSKLKYALPVSNQKSSKVSLLDRAVTYIKHLETSQGTLQTRLETAEGELARLRGVNETLMRNMAEQHRFVLESSKVKA